MQYYLRVINIDIFKISTISLVCVKGYVKH